MGPKDDPYTSEQLRDPQMNMLIVRPLVDRLYDPGDVSIGKYSPLTRSSSFTDSEQRG